MNLSDNAHVEVDKHQIGTKYTSNRHRLTLKFLCKGAQTIAQAPNRPNTAPDATQGMAHLGFRRRPRGESGTPRRQSNRRKPTNSSHRFGDLTSESGDVSFRAGRGDRTRPTAVARRSWIRSRRGGAVRAVRGSGGGARAPGRHGAEAAGDQSPRHGRRGERRGSPPGPRRGGPAWGQRGFWLSLGGNGKQGGGRQRVEPGAQLNRRFACAG